MSLNVAVSGAAGRMGRKLVSLVITEPDTELASACEAPGHPDLGRDAGELAGMGPVGVPVTDGIGGSPEVIVDFSAPEGAARAARKASEIGCPLVTGTTGLDAHVKAEIESAAGRVPVLTAANFSLGVNLLYSLVRRAAEVLGPGYDVEIVEAHHNQKADAPSGTALRLGEAAAAVLHRDPRKDFVHGRSGKPGPRGASEIGFHAVRAGDVVGEHTVIFGGHGERVELVHRAHTRDTFMHGALRAARFLVGRPAGRYSMAQVLGLE
jgi:4-hydroxy-tetrahydrodipicolinate reductase